MGFIWKKSIRGIIAIAAIVVMYSTAVPTSAEQNLETGDLPIVDQNVKTEVQPFAKSLQSFKNKNTGRYLRGNRYISYAYSSYSYGRWWVNRWNDGTFELSLGGGYALDDSAHGLRTFPRNKSKYQSWWVIRHGDGTISLKNQKTGRCIDDSRRYGLRTYPCNYSSYQRFY